MFTLLTALLPTSTWASTCEKRLVELGRSAVAQFERAERTLVTDVGFLGYHRGAIDQTAASELRTMAEQILEAQSSKETRAFTKTLRELADVLEGHKRVADYSRREVLKLPAAEIQELVPHAIPQASRVIPPPQNLSAVDVARIADLLSHQVGPALFHQTSNSTSTLKIESFESMARSSDDGRMYEIKGSQQTNLTSGEVTAEIESIKRHNRTSEAKFTDALAKHLNLEDVILKLDTAIADRTAVKVSSRTLFRIEHKLKLDVRDFLQMLRTGRIQRLRCHPKVNGDCVGVLTIKHTPHVLILEKITSSTLELRSVFVPKAGDVEQMLTHIMRQQ